MELRLKKIIDSLKNSSGQEFFEKIVVNLSSVLDTDYVFIARINSKKTLSSTIALAAKGKIVDNIVYELKDTPCADVTDGKICSFSEGVVKLYPKDQLLIDMNIGNHQVNPILKSKQV